jgi:acylglycerol lipase
LLIPGFRYDPESHFATAVLLNEKVMNMTETTEITKIEDLVESAGGIRILIRSWHPDRAATGAVIIVPGFNAHGGRYEWVADQFIAEGLAAYAVDLRGRGKSDGERFYVGNFEDYVADVEATVSLAKTRNPGLPIFLLGHSAGGIVACFFALEHQGELSGLIIESFSFELPAPVFALAALKGLSHVLPHSHLVRLKNADFSRDPVVVQSMNDDPLIASEIQATQTIAEMTRAAEQLKGMFAQITLPLLILHGTADKVAEPSGSQNFYDEAGASDKTLKIYEGYFHDLLHDSGKERVMADITRWIGSQQNHA